MSDRSLVEWGRLTILFALVLLLYTISTPTLASAVSGSVLIVIGEAIRIWAAGHLFKTQELITSGPYRYTRNPLYLGRFLILTGLGIAAWRPDGLNLWVLLAGWLIFFGYYMRRKERIEPARLEALHGAAYRDYFIAVPALFPRLRPWNSNSGGWRWDRFGRNREGITAVALVLLIAALFFKALR